MTETVLRVAIVGAQKGRVQKVVSLLQNVEDENISLPSSSNDSSPSVSIHVQYLACVATFDSYQNEQGNHVRYLAQVEYCGNQQQAQRGGSSSSSLAPFFDDTKDDTYDSAPSFPGVSGVAIGCGIESPEDVAMIESFIHTLAGENRNRILLVKCVAPNPQYTSMKQETQAYKALSEEEKNQVNDLRTMGPGKMAKFASSLAKLIVETAIAASQSTIDAKDTAAADTTDTTELLDKKVKNIESMPEPLFIDPEKTAYACKTCRTVLFGTDQLQKPSHVPRMHSFSKQQQTSTTCSSLFLQNGLQWMGDISTCVEGRLACPKCSTKIGHWKWAGVQCSCGTWVTPAIQVPFSKVDIIQPLVVVRKDGQQEESVECLLETTKTEDDAVIDGERFCG